MVRRLYSVPSPLQGDEENLLVSFCIPDTPDWRRLIVGMVEALTYGRAYDEQTGQITQAQAVGREIFATMSMCNLTEIMSEIKRTNAILAGESVTLDDAEGNPITYDYTAAGNITRIADALEAIRLAEVGEVMTLDQILAEMQASDIGDLADLIEVLDFLKALVPNFAPTISLAGLLEKVVDWRFREGTVNLMMDIAISQRAQATAQGGVGFHGLYDLASTTGGWIAAQTAKGGGPLGWFTGAAGWLWLKVRPAQLDGWTTWVDTVTGLLLGSIRGAGYDMVEQVKEQNKIQDAVENVLGGTYEPPDEGIL